MRKEFESLHQFLREEEAARLLALREKQEEKKREAEGRVDRMNQVITSLEEKIQLIEEALDAGGDGVEFLEVTINQMLHNWTMNGSMCLYLNSHDANSFFTALPGQDEEVCDIPGYFSTHKHTYMQM